ATMVAVARMLAGRGVATSAVELAVLTRPEHAVLLGDGAVFVGSAGAAGMLADGGWPAALRRVDVAGLGPRETMDAVLAHIPVAG
ncbi:MAG: hypothetical protein M3O86_02140, partial [Actinomycetota bacterium]|nr:hypothetical protein [Actinomycetota bacterium]